MSGFLQKTLWQLRLSMRHFDQRKIEVPAELKIKEGNKLYFDYWNCKEIFHAYVEDGQVWLERAGCGFYVFDKDLLSPEDLDKVLSIAKERPQVWW